MKTVILCGGEGTRLKEHTEIIPKALVEVGGKPILWHIMKIYNAYGITDFILCLGYKGEMIKQYFIDYNLRHNSFSIDKEGKMRFHTKNFNNWNITFLDTGPDDTTKKAQRLKQAKELIGDDELFLASYGDDLSNVNISALLKFHKSHNKIATLTAYTGESPLGVIDFTDRGEITKFREKPSTDYWINAGFFVFNRKIFDYLYLGDLELEVFEKLVEEKQIYAFKHQGFWKPMNTFRDHNELNELWNKGKAKWKIWDD